MTPALKLALSPLLAVQALRTRSRAPRLPEAAGEREGRVGQGPLLRLLVAGDSSAAGVGVAWQHEALAPPLAAALAEDCQATVQWRLVARSGVTTAQLLELLRAQALAGFDFAVVVSGVNDVIDQVPVQRAIAARTELADWLRNVVGVRHVVFAPLPPMGRLARLPQPLRWVAGLDASRHDRELDRWAAARADVSRAEVELPLGPEALAADGFHPGARSYRVFAAELARHLGPAARAALSPGEKR